MLKVYNVHLRMSSLYSPKPSLLLSIVLFRAREVPEGPPVEPVVGEDFGWGRFLSQHVPVHYVPGNHVTMMMPPHVGTLAELLMKCIQTGSVASLEV